MKRILATALGAVLCAGQAMASSPQDDDWEFQEDPARRISVAAARYDAGQMIVVQCRESALTVVLTGLPQSAEMLRLTAARADGRAVEQAWAPAGAPGAYRSLSAGRDVRFMRGGGLYTVRTTEGAAPVFRGSFDLPAQSANLDRVLTACGWAVADDRDAVAEASTVTTVNPDGEGRRRVPTQRGATSRAPRRELPMPPPPATPPPAEHMVSCIVRDMHLRECRADHAGSVQNADVVALVRANEGREVYPIAGADAAASEGRIIRLSGGRITIVDYLTTVPAR